MKSFGSYIFLLALIFLPQFAVAQQYETMRVSRIDIVPDNLPPNFSFNPSAARSRMQTQVGNLFSQSEFDQDLKNLAAEYDRIEPVLEAVGNELFITIHLSLKPRIRSILYSGNERISPKKLQKTLEIESGTLYDREEFLTAFNKLKILYFKKGYFEAELWYDVIPIPECNEIDIQIHVIEGRSGKIGEVLLFGLTSCEEEEILNLMLTKKYQFLFSWYSGRGTYHPEMVEQDRLQIINYMQNKGYADASVELWIEECGQPDRVQLVIRIERGQRFAFGDVSFTGNTIFCDDDIWDAIQFEPGTCYSPELIRQSIKAISELYGACGYIDIAVDAELTFREDCPIYDITFTLEEGDQYHVGLVRVFGNRCTQTRVILHETLLCPGEVFNNLRLEATEERLCNIGFFDHINVYPVQSQLVDPCGELNYRDIFVEVEEADTGNLGLFFGYGSQDRLFGGVEVTERNFNLAGVPRVLRSGPRALRGAGEYIHLAANVGQKQTSYLAQWSKPYFLDTCWLLGIEVEKTNNRVLSKAYEIKTYGGNIHGTYIINPFLKYDLHYRARYTRVSVSGTNLELRKEGSEKGVISASGFSFIYDSTNHPRRPTYGFRSRFMSEIAGIGGHYRFLRFAYLNSYYYPLSKKMTLKFRADLQFIWTYGGTRPTTLPLSERFYLGGESTVRGYRNFVIGPKFGPNEPRGGVSSMLLSEELQYNLLCCPCLDAFIFIDAGYVSLSEFSLGRPAAAVGFGFRIEIMRNTPMMFGLGWPIHPTETLNGQRINNAQRFFFALGGCF